VQLQKKRGHVAGRLRIDEPYQLDSREMQHYCASDRQDNQGNSDLPACGHFHRHERRHIGAVAVACSDLSELNNLNVPSEFTCERPSKSDGILDRLIRMAGSEHLVIFRSVAHNDGIIPSA
jgi:hypothetical protein